jgi:phage repressor protein C with HTH and peptisase S24 domain
MYNTASAGSGDTDFYENNKFEKRPFVRTSKSERANYVMKVNGNSMLPKYKDNDLILVKDIHETNDINVGEIGIFVRNDNEWFIKELGDNKFISLNPDYDDIILEDEQEMRVIGKVLGKAEKSRA